MSKLIACDECGDRKKEAAWGEDEPWVCGRCKNLKRGGRDLRGREKAAFASMCDLVIPADAGLPVEPEFTNGMIVVGDYQMIDYGTTPRDMIVV